MRPLLMGDLIAAARVTMLLPAAERPTCVARLLAEAEAADRYRLCHGRNHPRWGNGSLMGAAHGWPRGAEPFLSDRSFLDALGVVIAEVLRR